MVDFVSGMEGEEMSEEQKDALLEAIVKINRMFWAESDLMPAHIREQLNEQIEEGKQLVTGGLSESTDNAMSCTDCHKFHDTGDIGLAPDLTGYMSRQWMIDFIRNPADERFYGENNDRMPAFAPHDDPRLNQLDDKSLGLIVDWLRGDWRRSAPAADAATK